MSMPMADRDNIHIHCTTHLSLNMKLLLTFLASAVALSTVQANGCGGLLEGDSGQLELPVDSNALGKRSCLWIIQLAARSGVHFTLNKIGPAGIISLYPEHEATETVLNPIRLNAAAINSTVLTTGQVLVVVLTQSTSSTGVKFSWKSDASDESPITRTASYVDTPQGRVSFDQQERLTWALVVDPSKTLTFRTKTDFSRCQGIDPCRCSYFAVYEVTPEGYLQEVTRVCGHASESTTDQLYSQLVAFVYVNSTVSSAGSVEITWIADEAEVTNTTGKPESPCTTRTTTDSWATLEPPPSIKLDCGGIIDIGKDEVTFVEYKLGEIYDNNELCIWIINATYQFVTLSVVSEGFEPYYDGIDAYHVTYDYSRTRVDKVKLNSSSSPHLSGGQVFLLFSSDSIIPGTGFKLEISTHETFYEPVIKSLYHLDDESGSLKYPPFGNCSDNERFLAVLQVNTSNSLQLSALETDGYDYVAFFTVFPFDLQLPAYLHGAWSGTNTEGSLSYSVSARIVTFYSDGSVPSAGFTFEWAPRNQNKSRSNSLGSVSSYDSRHRRTFVPSV